MVRAVDTEGGFVGHAQEPGLSALGEQGASGRRQVGMAGPQLQWHRADKGRQEDQVVATGMKRRKDRFGNFQMEKKMSRNPCSVWRRPW